MTPERHTAGTVGRASSPSGEEASSDNDLEAESSKDLVRALLAASRSVLRVDDFATTARAIFTEACAVTGARSGYVALLSEDGDENEVLFLEAGGLPCSVDPELPMPIRGLRELAYRESRAVWDNDFMAGDWVSFLPPGHVDLRNVLFAPLVVDGATRGIMGLANKDGDFDDRDAAMASALGDLCAIALRNSLTLDRLRSTVADLEKALAEVRQLRGIIPICSSCKNIRNESGYWEQVETYIREHTDAQFTHGLCDTCVESMYGLRMPAPPARPK